MILFQEIVIQWSKASRGGKGAALRNAVPDTFPLPPVWEGIAQEATVLYHHVCYHEFNRFTNPIITLTVKHLQPEQWNYWERGVALRIESEKIGVQWQWTADMGAPERSRYPRGIAVLSPQTWVKLRHNGRMENYNNWKYQESVVRIGVSAIYDPLLFTGTPIAVAESIADLW